MGGRYGKPLTHLFETVTGDNASTEDGLLRMLMEKIRNVFGAGEEKEDQGVHRKVEWWK